LVIVFDRDNLRQRRRERQRVSITSALLLDPPLNLFVWIALRNDGVKGSGTEEDPYNGSPRQEKPCSLTALAYSGREATATTAIDHGYATGDVVMMAGVSGVGAAQFNGRFSIYLLTPPDPKKFRYAMLKEPDGPGTVSNATCARVFFQFDELMYPGFPEYTAIHLGPGVFETRGSSQAIGGWFPKNGWKIIGSGMEVTTLKIVHGWGAEVGKAAQYNAINNVIDAYIHDFEASDFTVDCNLSGQPIPADKDFSPVLCGAISVGGNRCRIRRVRAINWGTQSTIYECFVLTLGRPRVTPTVDEVTDCVIEECIVERPSLNSTQLISLIGIGGMERSTDGVFSPL
jgi:hypothetical protein